MLKPRNTIGALAALFFVVAMSAAADDNAAAPKAGKDAAHKDMKMTPEQFVSWAWKDGFGEVKLAKLGMEKSKHEKVREHARHILEDHQKANDELKTIAQKNNFTVTDEMTDEQKQAFDKLDKLSGADFDREFVNTMVQGHEKAIAKFEAMSRENAGDVSAFAAKHLPALKNHLAMMRDVHGDVKGAMLDEPLLDEGQASQDVQYSEREMSESAGISIDREKNMESAGMESNDLSNCELEFFVPKEDADEVSTQHAIDHMDSSEVSINREESVEASGRLGSEGDCELEFFVPEETEEVSFERNAMDDDFSASSEPDIEAERQGHLEPVEYDACADCEKVCDYCE